MAHTAQSQVQQSLAGTSATISLIASAAVAGVVEIGLLYPLDLIKTRLQLQITPPSSSAATATVSATSHGSVHLNLPLSETSTRRYRSVIDGFSKVLRQDGFRGLYRGLAPPLVLEIPRRTLKFGLNEQWGMVARKLFSIEDPFSIAQISIIGGLAGASEAFLITPFELVKVRLQEPTSKERYRGSWDCIQKLTRQEGVLSLSKGLEATIWRNSLWSAMCFATIHSLRVAFPERSTTSHRETMVRNFVAGTVGGALGVLISSPFDVVKTRIQAQIQHLHYPPKYGWTLSAVVVLVRTEGLRSLYKGLVPKLLRLGPGGGILLTVFEATSSLIRNSMTTTSSSSSISSQMM